MASPVGELVQQLRTLQQQFTKLIQQRTTLDSQLTENTLVQQELALLTPDAAVYKLVGPVLQQQALPEAKSNVDKRIQYIQSELKRVDAAVTESEQKQQQLRDQIMKLQQGMEKMNAAVTTASA